MDPRAINPVIGSLIGGVLGAVAAKRHPLIGTLVGTGVGFMVGSATTGGIPKPGADIGHPIPPPWFTPPGI